MMMNFMTFREIRCFIDIKLAIIFYTTCIQHFSHILV